MRRQIRTVVLACALGLGVPSLFSTAQAFNTGPFDQFSYMTFSQPVAVPGATLPAGKYIFRLPDRDNARTVMQVMSADRSHVYAMFQTTPTTREKTTHDPTVTFYESPVGTPMPIKAWYYADDRFGLEFVYPHADKH